MKQLSDYGMFLFITGDYLKSSEFSGKINFSFYIIYQVYNNLPRYPNAIPCTEKFRQKVNMWGGISFKGPTSKEIPTPLATSPSVKRKNPDCIETNEDSYDLISNNSVLL